MYNKNYLLLFLFFITASVNLLAQEEKITNEIIYRELKVFEAKMEERFKSVEEKFNSVDLRFKSIEQRIDLLDRSLNYRIDNLYTFLWVLSGIFTAMVLSFAGLLFWDRKTIVETSVKKSFEKIEKDGTQKKLLDVLKELAKEDTKVAQVLKNFNLL